MANLNDKNAKNWVYYAGWALTALPAFGLLASAAMKLSANPQMVTNIVGKFGYASADMLLPLGIIELAATLLYLVPRTSYLGAVLLTGYLGGAIATHVRVSDNFIAPLFLGVLVWGGLFLRERRLRELLPLRQTPEV